MRRRSTPHAKEARRTTPVEPPMPVEQPAPEPAPAVAPAPLADDEVAAAPAPVANGEVAAAPAPVANGEVAAAPAPVANDEVAAAPAPVADDEVAAYMADPELSGMFVTDAVDHLGTIEAVVLKLEASPGDSKLLNDLFRPFHTVKGNAGVLGFTSIQDLAHRVETLLDLARSGQHVIGAAEIDVVLRAVDLLLQMTQDLPARAAGQPAANLADARQSLMDAVDALIANGSQPEAVDETAPAPAPAEPAAEAARADEPALSSAPTGEGQSTVKVSTQKLDSLVDLVGELVIAQSILAEDPIMLRSADDRLNRQLAHVKRIAGDLQRHTMAMRMVPIRQTFQKMARHVRDLSRKSGKPIDLVLTGEDTELDRKVVEHITDPLMHMIRNTVDHGIETGDVRAAAGKPVHSRLRLSAFHQAGYIVIEIEDDGAGLDTAKILEKAIGRGLVAANDALSLADIHQLIFSPGFSTKDEVTELSGRGVGMDVVRRNVEALRGAVDIRTVAGQGTTFTLRLPLTLATVDGLVLKVGGERFVIPTFAVRESLRASADQVHTVGGVPRLIQIRDRLIPILHLGETFGIADAWPSVADATVVVLEDGGRPLAVVVDELVGKQEVVIKTLGEMFAGVRGVAGGAILGDGRIGLILDAGGLMSLIDRSALAA
jgi:two-component system chemotaxis sensor kinase CheA